VSPNSKSLAFRSGEIKRCRWERSQNLIMPVLVGSSSVCQTQQWGDRRLDEVSAAEVSELAGQRREAAVKRRNGRGEAALRSILLRLCGVSTPGRLLMVWCPLAVIRRGRWLNLAVRSRAPAGC
jgi:hypothetical protein